jgi:hypothetical protein
MYGSVKSFLKRSLGCHVATENFRFGNVGFDVVGYSPSDSIVHVVECKPGSKPVDIGHAFGQLLAYKSVLAENGYEFLTKFANKVRMKAEDIATAVQEEKLRVKFYVGLSDEACKNVTLIQAMKESLHSVGIMRVKQKGGCRGYLWIRREKDYDICQSEMVLVQVRRVYSHKDFLRAVERRLKDSLAETKYSDFETYTLVDKPYGDFEQFWFGRNQFHFEVTLRKRKFIEVALHLEGKRADNLSLYRHLKKSHMEIENVLGPSAKIARRGTRDWRHVHEHLPRTELTDEQVGVVAGRTAEYIKVLQPMVEQWEGK